MRARSLSDIERSPSCFPFLTASTRIDGQGLASFSGSVVPALHSAHTLQPGGSWAAGGGGPERQEVVRRTEQRPFTVNRAMPPRQELPEPVPLLDLPEDRLAGGCPLRIQAPASRRAQLVAHSVGGREPSGDSAARRGRPRSAMLLPIRGDQRHAAQGRELAAIQRKVPKRDQARPLTEQEQRHE